jgi:hypothetical protein
VDAELPHRVADGLADLVHELGVEARAPRERGGERGRLPGGEPGEALLVYERGDLVTGVVDEPALLLDEAARALGRVDRVRAEDTRELAEPVRLGVLLERVDVGLHRVRHRRDVAALTRPAAALPEADKLVELLLRVDRAISAQAARQRTRRRRTSRESSLMSSSTRALVFSGMAKSGVGASVGEVKDKGEDLLWSSWTVPCSVIRRIGGWV